MLHQNLLPIFRQIYWKKREKKTESKQFISKRHIINIIMKLFNEKIFYVASSFLAGFAVMTVELISSRIVAPIIGSSVFTWTSVIGITLLGLAAGSYVGGQIADKKDVEKSFPLSFLVSAILVALIPTL